jgi:hypothetical protein
MRHLILPAPCSYCSHAMPRRFPPPWTVARTAGGWSIIDATGQAVAYTYGRDDATGVGYAGLTVDEARRIAANMARLPELLGKAD